MTKIPMLKTKRPLPRATKRRGVLNFEHLNFDIVSNLGFRISDFKLAIESAFVFIAKLDINFKILSYEDI